MSAQPRLMNLNAPTIRDQRTLVWLQQQSAQHKWKQWDGIVTSLEEYHTWKKQGATIVGIVLIDKPVDPCAFLSMLTAAAKDMTMMLLSHDVMSIQSETFWVKNFDNILVLEDVLGFYPSILMQSNVRGIS
jgi:hypothetical protein